MLTRDGLRRDDRCTPADLPTRLSAVRVQSGTLPGHAERGQERLRVEWDRGTGAVWYHLLAFSRPNHRLTRPAYPLTRRIPKRFARGSAAALLRAERGACR